MADTQVGNIHGVAAVGNTKGLVGNVTADGLNTVTLDNVRGLSAGDRIDIIDPATGTVLASDRLVTNITNAGVVTYDGADVVATAAHDVFSAGSYSASGPININGGHSAQEGYHDIDLLTIDNMRTRLKAIDAGLYTDAKLNQMTSNDMVYAIRLADNPTTINS